MNKFSKVFNWILSCSILLGMTQQAVAQQASEYIFTQSVDTYVPLTGGTVINSGTADNALYTVTLPSAFTYLGASKTTAYITTNGILAFPNAAGANSVSSATYGLISATLANTGGGIAAFANDLGGYAASVIRHEQVGNEYVFQWENYKRYGVNADTLNFQIRLNTVDGSIKIVYGSMKVGASTSYQPQVGLRGILPTDFNNRKVEATTGAWVNSIRGTSNTDVCYYNAANAATIPASGTTFLYTLPSCVSASNIVASNITETTATISWSNALTLPANGYEYYISTSNIPPSNTTTGVAVADTFALLTGLSNSTEYYVFVRSICSTTDVSSWSTAYKFMTACGIVNVPYAQDFESITTPTLPSCTSVENIGAGNPWRTATALSSKVLRYAYSSSNAANTWFYTPGINLTAGTSYRITYKYAASSSSNVESMKVAFGTAAQAAAMTTVIADYPSFTNTTFADAVIDFTPTTTDVYYIGFHAYSAANRYNIYVDNITIDYSPSCFTPSALVASNITATSVNLEWLAPAQTPANGYEYYVSTSNTVPDATTIGTTNATTAVVESNLSPNTTYYVWVRSVCSATDKSEWTASATFTTLCVPVTTLPWLENFDALTTANATFVAERMSSCWTGINKASVMSSASTYITARSGNNVLAFQFGTNTTTGAWGITPAFDLEAGVSYRFKFYYKNYSTSPFQSLQVALGTAATAADMTINIGTPLATITNTAYVEYYVDFIVPTNGIYYIGLNVRATTSPMYMMVDDVTLDYSPSCVTATDLQIANITANSADLSFSAATIIPANGYEYYISTSNVAPTAADAGIATTGTNAILPNLIDNTTYYVWVRSVCSATDKSEWSARASFLTNCLATNVPYLLDFESATTPTLPSCTSVENLGNGNNWGTVAPTTGAFTSSKVLRYLYTYSNPANTWFYTQGVNLVAGQSYRISYDYGNNSATSLEEFKVAYGTSAVATAMTNILATHTSNALNTRTSTYVDFIPTTSGVYYFGFHAYSAANQNALYIDNILVDVSPTCLTVTNLVTSNVTTTSVDLSWTASAQTTTTDFEYFISTSSIAPTATTTGVAIAGNTATIANLDHSTAYYVWVRSLCSTTDISQWSQVTTFNTACGVMDIPYSLNFESVTIPALPNCTSNENIGTGNNWVTATALGSKVLRYAYNSSNAANVWFYTNAVNLVAGQSYRISYKYASSSASGAENMKVAYGNAASATAMTTILADHNTFAHTAYVENYVDFTPATSGVYYFGFHAYSIANRYSIYVDDIYVDLSPTCFVPTTVTYDNITATSVDISWLAPIQIPANGYEYYVSTSNTAPDANTVGVATTATTATLTGLTPNTSYYVWVRSVCSATDASVWTRTPITFYTGACLPTGVGNYYIKAFTTTDALANINYSATSGGVGYINQLSTVLSAAAGAQVNYSFTPSSGTNYFYIWIDWNNDFDFDDTGETILASSLASSYAGSFTVGANQPIGSYRMRIANSWSGLLTACGHAANGNYIDFTFEVRSRCTNPITLTTAVDNICNGGRATATVTANTANPTNLTYIWSDGQTTATATGLQIGFYTVTVSDGAYCTEEATIEVLSSIVAAATEQLTADCGNNTGSAHVVAVGNNLSYEWSNGATTNIITGLAAGTYTVTVTDNICQKIADVQILHENVFVVEAQVNNENANIFGNGSIAIVNPLNATYQWSNGATTSTIDNLSAGTYTVTVTDANGCFVQETFEVQLVTSVDGINLSTIAAYPNPTTSMVNIAGLPMDAKVIVVNNLGQVVLSFISQNEIEQIDLSTLAPSTYWIRIESQEQSIILPIIRIK